VPHAKGVRKCELRRDREEACEHPLCTLYPPVFMPCFHIRRGRRAISFRPLSVEVHSQPCCSSKDLEVRNIQRLALNHVLEIPRCSYSPVEYSRLDAEPVMGNYAHQQSSRASVAYVLLGGFFVVVSDLPFHVSQAHLIFSKYSLLSWGIKQMVRYTLPCWSLFH
jgi:hypothetical protein